MEKDSLQAFIADTRSAWGPLSSELVAACRRHLEKLVQASPSEAWLAELGVGRVTLSTEDDRRNLAALLGRLGEISGVTELTSTSSLGGTNIVVQFDMSRNIDGAARDVQAAINAARPLLPSGMPSMPTYRKINPADMPVMILSLTSDIYSRGQMYDAASTILAQRLSQVEGIGQVSVSGSALPAVRVEIDPQRLSSLGVGLEEKTSDRRKGHRGKNEQSSHRASEVRRNRAPVRTGRSRAPCRM